AGDPPMDGSPPVEMNPPDPFGTVDSRTLASRMEKSDAPAPRPARSMSWLVAQPLAAQTMIRTVVEKRMHTHHSSNRLTRGEYTRFSFAWLTIPGKYDLPAD